MKQNNKFLRYLLLISGLALIFTGFFVFFPNDIGKNIFWLDLSVVCLVFIVTVFTASWFFGINLDFEEQIGGLGILLIQIRIYSLFALTIIIIGYLVEARFLYQLFFQLAAVFLLLIGYFFSQISLNKSLSVQREQNIDRNGKEQILNAINQFEILISSNSANFGTEKQKIDKIKETVRYFSPTNSQLASQLDSEILSTIQRAYSVVYNDSDGKSEVFSLLSKCEELLKIRKNTSFNEPTNKLKV
jgi:hypothetical protein